MAVVAADDYEFLVVRHKGKLHVMVNRCPYDREARLSEGTARNIQKVFYMEISFIVLIMDVASLLSLDSLKVDLVIMDLLKLMLVKEMERLQLFIRKYCHN